MFCCEGGLELAAAVTPSSLFELLSIFRQIDDQGPIPSSAKDKESDGSNASLPSLEKTEDQAETVQVGLIEHEYVEGLNLYLLMASISFVFFLLMLNMSIIVTVSRGHPTDRKLISGLLIHDTGDTSNHQ